MGVLLCHMASYVGETQKHQMLGQASPQSCVEDETQSWIENIWHTLGWNAVLSTTGYAHGELLKPVYVKLYPQQFAVPIVCRVAVGSEISKKISYWRGFERSIVIARRLCSAHYSSLCALC